MITFDQIDKVYDENNNLITISSLNVCSVTGVSQIFNRSSNTVLKTAAKLGVPILTQFNLFKSRNFDELCNLLIKFWTN